jgi:hypothetical protein
MSLQLLTWRPELVQPRVFTWRVMKRRLKSRQRAISKYFRSQYYVWTAFSDGLRAFRLNEDIAWGGLLIMAWASLLIAAIIPAALSAIAVLGAVKIFGLTLAEVTPYFITLEGLALGWALWVFIHYSLLPQVLLFASPNSWKDAVKQAKQLVNRKGRVFILSTYLTCLAGLSIVYGIAWSIHAVTGTSVTLTFLLLSIVPLSLVNGLLTMLYRKRRLARS